VRVEVRGAIDEISPLGVHGTIGRDASDLEVRAEQLRLPPLNPYLEPLLRYAVTSGVARWDARIRLDGSALRATNALVLSRLALARTGEDLFEGELGAPLAVALALMKDYRGDIRLDLPVSGDLAAQEYRVENVVGIALRKSLVGALRSPLTLLGAVFRREDAEAFDLRPIPFAAGDAELGPEGEARIAQIAGLLTRQPGLVAVLIPDPSPADADRLRELATTPSVAGLRTLADARAALVTRRLLDAHGLAADRVTTAPWDGGELGPETPPGVDVQLRGR